MNTVNTYTNSYVFVYIFLDPADSSPLVRTPGPHPNGCCPTCLESQWNDPVPGLLSLNRGARASNRPSAA